MIKLAIKPMNRDCALAVAKLHISGISTGFISSLGQEFVTALYEAIAEKIRFYKASPQTARQHGENGYKYVCEHYDRRKLVAKYRELIRQRVIKV
jgi:glycosyltransferase involved in cell wall biosynthesis